MAFSQDLVTRIVNVRWGGTPIFVFGQREGGEIYYVDFTDRTHPAVSHSMVPGELPYDPSHDPDRRVFYYGVSSFAMVDVDTDGDGIADSSEPVFLLAGSALGETQSGLDSNGLPVRWNDYQSKVMRSADGIEWALVYTETAHPDIDLKLANALSSNGLVRDPAATMFFYNQHHTEQLPGVASANEIDQVFSSLDGRSWAEASSVDTGANPGFVSVFEAHCHHNRCTDKNGNHVPDGVMWQDSRMADDDEPVFVIRPTSPPYINYGQGGVNFQVPGEGGSNEIEISQIVDGDRQVSRVAIPGVVVVTCAAGAGGVLLVGGYAGSDYYAAGTVAYSLDRGQNWQELLTTPIGVTTMVGGVI